MHFLWLVQITARFCFPEMTSYWCGSDGDRYTERPGRFWSIVFCSQRARLDPTRCRPGSRSVFPVRPTVWRRRKVPWCVCARKTTSGLPWTAHPLRAQVMTSHTLEVLVCLSFCLMFLLLNRPLSHCFTFLLIPSPPIRTNLWFLLPPVPHLHVWVVLYLSFTSPHV